MGLLEEAADIRKRLAVVMDGSDDEYDAAFASAKQDTHNSKFGFNAYLQLLEDFNVICGEAEGKFTTTGQTVGECRLYATLHTLNTVKPDILAPFPKLSAFFTTFGSKPQIQEILKTGGKMPGTFKPYYKPRVKETKVGAPKLDEFGMSYWAKSDDTLLPAPANPKFKVALCASYATSHPAGGSDKLVNGHRFDTVAIANGLIIAGMDVKIIFYTVEEHDRFFEVVAGFDAIVIRINPGQITANGGSQQKFDDDMMKLAAKVPVWPTPETMSKMGAKDALCQIKTMDFGLEDTLGYYSPADISVGLRKTVAFQPRVVKQNRGSAGEGIWIIKLKSENYCKTFGEREAADDEVLILKEANDNHIDEGEARFVVIGAELNRVEHYVYIGGVGGETIT